MRNIQVLLIDPQVDFIDPDIGTLVVPGAKEDSEKLAGFLQKMQDKFTDIHVTLDSHRTFHVAHGIMWINSKGENPNPFSIINIDDVKSGVWGPVNPAWTAKLMEYLEKLTSNGRYPLCIWPQHCKIGTPGHAIYKCVYDALQDWEMKRIADVDYVTKGSNIFTEHYSAVQADVPDPSDPGTQLNTQLIDILQTADDIYISGQAKSHCVANTITDIADNFGEDNIKKFILLEDTCSNVSGFEQLGDDFVKNMVARGMKVAQTTDF